MMGKNHHMWGKKRSQSYKNKMSIAMKGRKQSTEHIKKLSKIRKGKKRSKESIRKGIEKQKKSVNICGMLFDSVNKAMDNAKKFFNISGRTLYRRLRSNKFSDYKYIGERI